MNSVILASSILICAIKEFIPCTRRENIKWLDKCEEGRGA